MKALFRRAQAYIETNDLDLAELDLKKALQMEPDNGSVFCFIVAGFLLLYVTSKAYENSNILVNGSVKLL